ncbi:NAD(P)H-quinone oxidoreductase [Hymenobacter ginsengisoli]|uniref:NAD(P)H-quinone oxidoreductase n=1 Tax=Hymenobacter ginsengisoli TaxID=1051626 RepID=A0ABP8QP55_9BACT|nr:MULTISPECIES: NAD(P)H-quinone oxidoreductase [unclassified Hymenobacter]MBO2032779.1 NAD(P)H-quinone oxidoreductase [Hymenobacter sp. BT559]
MKAIVIVRPGGPDVLQLQERPQPVPAAHEVLIKVKAAGLNRSDIALREGKYGGQPVAGVVPGLEVAGVVVAVGAAPRWQVGDHVCALLSEGAYAEYAAVDARHCLPVPIGWSLEQAASLPETTFTVWANVFQDAALQPRETVLVHGGSSGIGLTLIQLGHALGHRVLATAGSPSKCQACERLGAARCVNYKHEDFEQAFRDEKIDVILDMVGGDYTAKNLRLLAPDGRLQYLNAMQGAKVEINLLDIMTKRLRLSGSMLRPRSAEFKAALAAEVEKYVWPLAAAGQLEPVIYRTFPLAQAAEAQQLMASSEHIGKILLVNE